jgi:hypothetical protein
MTHQAPSDGKPIWRELLSHDDIFAWVNDPIQRSPIRLKTDFSCPGVYRFIFPVINNEAAFYVGEACNLGNRLIRHFRRQSLNSKTDPAGWRLNGKIRNSRGNFTLQFLEVQGKIDICGVELNQECLENTFARRLLENWSILRSLEGERLRRMNVGPTNQKRELTRIFSWLGKGNRKRRPTMGLYEGSMVEIEKMRRE